MLFGFCEYQMMARRVFLVVHRHLDYFKLGANEWADHTAISEYFGFDFIMQINLDLLLKQYLEIEECP